MGGLLRYTNAGASLPFLPEIIASLYLGRQRGEGYIFDDTGLSGLRHFYFTPGSEYVPGTAEYLISFAEFLENPERSEDLIFDQQRYTTAIRECLQLCLCNHHRFSKEAVEFARRDNVLRRSKPLIWIKRLGVHSRIRKGRHQLKVRQRKSLKTSV